MKKSGMKKAVCAMALMAAMLLNCAAYAEISFEGKVVASETKPVLAPFGGMVDEVRCVQVIWWRSEMTWPPLLPRRCMLRRTEP